MRSILIILALTASAVFLINCGRGTTENLNVAVAPVDEAPKYADAASALAAGNKHFEENKTEEAIAAYKEAVKMDPDLAEAHFKLGISYALIESEQELIETPVEPTESNTKEKKEKKTNSRIAFENAVTAYKKIINNEPENHAAYFNLGRALNLLNEDEDARKALEKSVKLQPEDTQYQTELGAILIKLAQYDEAVRALKKAIDIDEANAQAQELLAKAEAGKKRVDFGADKLKDQLTANKPPPSPSSNKPDSKDEKNSNTGDVDKKKEVEKKKEPENKKNGAISESE